MSTHFLEIETKYGADDIKMADFAKVAESLAPSRKITAGSYDFYFEKEEDHFLRYREGAAPELTMKQKSKDTNNWVRTELNLPLNPAVNSIQMARTVTKFCDMLGFKHNFTIWKTYMVYFWDTHNVVYYVVHDDEMKEKGRFVEIEIDEHKAWASEEEAWKVLTDVEKAFEPLGITAAKRMRLSLYERFRKAASG